MTDTPLIWDAHSCIPLHPDATTNHLHRHLEAGASYASVNVGMDFNPLSQILSTIASFRQQIQADPRLVLAQTTEDIHNAHQNGRLAVGFDLEGAVPLCERPELVPALLGSWGAPNPFGLQPKQHRFGWLSR